MKFFYLLFLPFLLFSISIENEDLLDQYKDLSYHQNFLSVGAVLVKKNSTHQTLGTATLIHPNVALTGAHVVEDCKEASVYFTFSNKLYHGKVILHPKYTHTQKDTLTEQQYPYDIALIFFEEAILDITTPILSLNSTVPVDEPYYIIGYGEWISNTPDNIFDKRLASRTNFPFFQKNYYYIREDNIHQIPLLGFCSKGDSGGPLMNFSNNIPIIYGVTSCRTSSKDAVSFSFYTPVATHAHWIFETIKKELGE